MKEILSLLPFDMAEVINRLSIDRQIYELRLHIGHPPILISSKDPFEMLDMPPVSMGTIRDIVLKACGYALYAYEQELAQGFLTLPGNHRIGLCGTAVYDEKRNYSALSEWSGLNIRFANKSINLYSQTVQKIASSPFFHTLIAGPPACGKTTLLRCIANAVSTRYKVAIIDERDEIICSRATGPGAFVYRRIDKQNGSTFAIRSMSPQLIIFDEIGNTNDLDVISNCSRAGCIVYATIHKTRDCSAKTLFDQNPWCDRVIVFSDMFETKEYLRD